MSGIWPGTTRCVAMLGFDVDGVTGAINRNPDSARLPSLMSMREYGPSIATPRILDLLDGHSIKASFYIPGYVVETHEQLVLEIKARGHEIAHHGYMHEPPATLSRKEEAHILDKGIDIIQRVVGERPLGYRSPSWELSEDSLSLLAERGFVYDSSLMGDDAPYIVDADGHDLIEIPVNWELDDFPYFSFAPALDSRMLMASPQQVYEVWEAAFEGMYHYGRSFVLTMHPFLIGRPGRLLMLDKLIRHMKSFKNVKFMRAIDVAEMWVSQNKKQGLPS